MSSFSTCELSPPLKTFRTAKSRDPDLRLCRSICGKALLFRTGLNSFAAMPPLSNDGKSHVGTSGGTAARDKLGAVGRSKTSPQIERRGHKILLGIIGSRAFPHITSSG